MGVIFLLGKRPNNRGSVRSKESSLCNIVEHGQINFWRQSEIVLHDCRLLMQGEDMRLCTAEVHEADQPRKLGRGVELRRIEVRML